MRSKELQNKEYKDCKDQRLEKESKKLTSISSPSTLQEHMKLQQIEPKLNTTFNIESIKAMNHSTDCLPRWISRHPNPAQLRLPHY